MRDFLFIAFPYAALLLAIGVGIYRKFWHPYTYSSLSSELLEKRRLFWGSVPFHYGLTTILLIHLFAGLFPGALQWILGGNVRGPVLEITGIALGLYTLFGIIVLILRRIASARTVRRATSYMDGFILFILLVQIYSGIVIAIFDRWGGVWYTHTATPWFWSLATFHPNASTVASLPPFVQFHFLVGFLVILLFPFSRLVHLVMLPFYYLWRPYQVVVWNRWQARNGAREVTK